MANFIRGANPIWYFVDLVGNQLNDQFYISFLTNTFPYLPQPVFQDVNGTIPWANPLEFFPNGTLPDNLYFNEDLVYRLEIRQGPTQSDPLIYEINNYTVGTGGTPTPESLDVKAASNQVSNPQFAQINFTSPVTITTAGTYNIAPGWNLVLTGSGSTTVTQLILSGTTDGALIGSPPFALEISNSGWSTATLEQVFNNNGALWSNGAIAFTMLARVNAGSAPVSVNYIQSDAGIQLPLTVTPTSITNSNFQTVFGYLNVPASTNTDTSDVATTKIQIVLPVSNTIELTNIQVVGQNLPLPVNFDILVDSPQFNQETIERGIDNLFYYYQPQLNFKPIRSYLVGWDFALNPSQFGSTQTVTGSGAYIWDQTVATSSPNFNIVRDAVTGGLQATSTGANGAIAFMQYLSGSEVNDIIANQLSVNVSAFSSVVTNVNCKVYLFRGSSAATIPVLPLVLGTLSSTGDFTLSAANWSAIPRGLYGLATANVTGITSSNQLTTLNYDYGFSGWQITDTAQINDTDKFAIVVTFACPTNATTFTIRSISLVPGLIPTRPAPQEPDEVLRECQYYYEQSYPPGVVPGSATFQGAIWAKQIISGSAPINLTAGSFTLTYKTIKRVAPNITIYRPRIGTTDTVDSYLYNAGADLVDGPNSFSGNWTTFAPASVYNVTYTATTTAALQTNGAAASNPDGFILFQYVLDSRLGVV